MRKGKWLRWVLFFGVALLVVSAGLSRVLQTGAARGYLIARLEASFGRPVEVGRFDFSLLNGARLEADSVTVAEDPAFGHEYFLRAESLTAGLRWRALLRGRFEFGTLFLSRPSLNLVRDRQGTWNIERWLPPVSAGSSVANPSGSTASRSAEPARLSSIEVDGGRINFKQDNDKSGFALVDVSGRVEEDRPGRWTLDLQAQPMRAGVELQQIGTLRLRGDIGGTSARLQPARLSLTWRDVSLADALRISRQFDYGVRGELALDLSARVEPPGARSDQDAGSDGARWSISGTARMTGIHGWRLAGRDNDPVANLAGDATWRLGQRHVQITKLLLEMPHSHLQGSGEVEWGDGFRPQLHIMSSSLGLADVLAWYRAFRPGVADNLRMDGTLGVDATFEGWPFQLAQGALASVGGTLAIPSLPAPLRIGPINASASHGGLDFVPTELSFSSPGARTPPAKKTAASPSIGFTVGGTILPAGADLFGAPPNWSLSVEGGTPRMQDWLLLSRALAQPLATGWAAAGSLFLTLRANHRAGLPATLWSGTADLAGLTVSPAFLNQPLRLSKAHFEFGQSQRTITLSSSQAFGATWQGTLARKDPAGHWTFDLTADHLDAAELDRWLGPRARPGFLARITDLVTGAAKISDRESVLTGIAARGRLRVAELEVSPLRLEHFDGQMDVDGRTITIPKGAADFCGGKVAGKFVANLLAEPAYEFDGRFDHVDLASLAQDVPSLRNRISGTASASVVLGAHGVGRQALIHSILGQGTLDAQNAQLRGLDLAASSSGIEQSSSSSRSMVSAKGSFRIGEGRIEITKLAVDNSKTRFQAEGNVDFSQVLDLRIRPEVRPAAALGVDLSAESFLLRGTLGAPRLAPFSTPAKPKVRGGSGKP
jgi:AsmA-like C-terminal region/AsmA family